MKIKNTMELLPIGTVVLLKNAEKRLMIFGIGQTDTSNREEYDYIGVLYPEGSIGDEARFLFNHSDIEQVYFVGYHDDERAAFLEKLASFYRQKREEN